MWIMTPDGILMPAAIPTDVVLPSAFSDEPWDMQVRARDRKVLVRLRKDMRRARCLSSEIHATPDHDYEYRVYVYAREFAQVIARQIECIDYEKFKPISLRKGRGGRKLHDLYNAIWYQVARAYDSPILGRYAQTEREIREYRRTKI